MIEIRNLCKSFGTKQVLKDINIKIEDGTIFGLVGINGAGKSTLLRIIAGVYKSDEGEVLFNNQDVFENELAKTNIFFLPDDPFYDFNTTPTSLLEKYETFYKVDKDAYFKYLSKYGLNAKQSMHNFSKGMKRQVFIGLALAIKPKYLLLDEAFDGLDPLARLELKRKIIKIQEENNMTVIISSHSLRELEDICDSYGLLDKMTISSSGDINSSLEKYHKYQVAFKEELEKDKFDDMEIVSFKKDKRIITIVTKDDYEAFSNRISKLHPLIIDEIEIDFEELFVIEVEARGYLKND